MHTPLDVAIGIGETIREARTASVPMDLARKADALFLRFPDCGYSRVEIAQILQEEATAVGLKLH